MSAALDIPTLARRLAGSRAGIAATEFALITPVLLLLLMGLFDVGYTAYIKTALQGAVQKAARDSALQGSASPAAAAALDLRVRQQVQALGVLSAPTITRRFFKDYNKAAANQYEPFGDGNGNHRCDNNESYTDTNRNSTWDSDGGDAGIGGAQDRTIYTVAIEFERFFPLHSFVDVPRRIRLVATTVLANQPYADQTQYAPNPPSRQCS